MSEPPVASLFTPDFEVNPYPIYDRLRSDTPVFQVGDTNLYAIARYDDVLAALKAPDVFSSVVGELELSGQMTTPVMLFSDPPMHTRLRKLVAKAFTPRVVETQRESIQARCDELIGAMCSEDRVDLVEKLAYPLPVQVIATMLGVQDGDMARFKYWSDTIIENIGLVLFQGKVEGVAEVNKEFEAYFSERIEALRKSPEDHLLSELVHVETEDGMLTQADLLMFARLLLVAGNETTTGLIVSSARVLDRYPEMGEQLRADPKLIPTFIEEALRYYSPFQMTVRRTMRDVDVCGVTIPKHKRVLIMLGSANRDPAQFERAPDFVIDRDPNPHVAFGFGIHFCIGAHLARLEGQLAAETLLGTVQGLRVTDDVIKGVLRFGGPPKLNVEFQR